MNYPLAETFHSIKGEGIYTGTAMFFIRFAGCNVGRPLKAEHELVDDKHLPKPPQVGPHLTEQTDAFVCHAHDGRPFFCDTDFHKYEERDHISLIEEAWEDRIVITGGEPLIHLDKLPALLDYGRSKGKQFHLETSGTIRWDNTLFFEFVAVAPKLGCRPQALDLAHEVKLLVDKDFNLEKTLALYPNLKYHAKVFVQPVNPPYGVDKENIARCMAIQRLWPKWVLSPQLHKLLGVK